MNASYVSKFTEPVIPELPKNIYDDGDLWSRHCEYCGHFQSDLNLFRCEECNSTSIVWWPLSLLWEPSS